jgi:hemerythrin-like metal-binding protein
MSFIKWVNDYSIGVDSIDNQHKRLVSMINQLQKSIPSGIVNQEMGLVLKSLVDYTKYHFAEEEKLMEQIHFSELERHRQLHIDLTAQVTGIIVGLKKGKEQTVFELIEFLKNWLIDHIIKEDRKIGEAVATKVKTAMRSV